MVLPSCGPHIPPKAIFTTAYTEFAVEGFERCGLITRSNPFHLPASAVVNKAQSAHEQRTSEGKAHRFFGFKADKRTIAVPVERIHALESDGDYTRLFTWKTRPYMLLGSLTGHLTELEDVLLRAHCLHAVNLAQWRYSE